MARIERKLKLKLKLRRYPTDLVDDDWNHVRELLPPIARRGRRRRVDLREVLNAIRHLVRGGTAGRFCRRTFRPGRSCIGGSAP
jgi:putative transposase